MTDYWHQFPSNVTGIGNLFQWANGVIGGHLGNMIVGVTFIIAFISLGFVSKKSSAFAAASFITFIIAVLFSRIEQMINPMIIIALIVAVIVGFIWTATDTSF